MSYFIINGGKKLHGSIKVNPCKNSAVAILCASSMIKGETTVINVPAIEEIKRIIEVLTSIGLKITWQKEHELKIINDGKIKPENINYKSFAKTRSGLLLLGSLCAIKTNFSLPKTGGCKLGKRTVNPHILALEHMGIKIKETADSYIVAKEHPVGAEFVMYESGDTATENAIMAASLIKGKTIIHFASSNYMVRDLCYFLKKAGAKINGLNSFKITVEGVKKLEPVKDYPIMPDPIEAMTLISIAVTTKSNLKIIGCPIDFLRLELEKLRVMGQKLNISAAYKSANNFFDLVDIEIIPSKLIALPDKIYGSPYPGLNMDNLPLFLPILTQADGQTLVHDWTYENRAIYYTELNRLGADIMLHDPHRVTVSGPIKLKPAEIICPPALRPSINLLTCMLAASGKSILRNAYPIDRGYENIVGRLNGAGADILRIDE
ncbi:UDP-N-acetylglucosamine 1-carboxyvinyltransferase [Patescibacteria group bacterium]|nr:UDP-N-acetylglucosamine 1-carboxyvinyltransferase [Patescibacteria group bacterium]MBU4455308.1 UDP-N-acetylglucosamine 1-carboxyvinyltransferase [Patescibacteria group bacterium]